MTYPTLTIQELYLGALEAEKRSNKVAGPLSALALLASVAVDTPALLKSPVIVNATDDSTTIAGRSLRKRPRSMSDSSTAAPSVCSSLAPKRRRLCAPPAPPGAYLDRVRALCKSNIRVPIGGAIVHDMTMQVDLTESDDEGCDSDEELVQTKEGQMNRKRIQRIEALRSDDALFMFSRNNVWCNQGCGKIIALDSRRHYYLDSWKKHRKNCKGGIHPPIIISKECKRSRNRLFDQWRKEWDKAHKGRRASKSRSCQTFSCITLKL